jgi:hypothetical protein
MIFIGFAAFAAIRNGLKPVFLLQICLIAFKMWDVLFSSGIKK